MSALIKVPVEFVESVAEMQLPPRTATRLRDLSGTLDRLTAAERNEWEALLELQVMLARFRDQALHLLGRDLVA